MSKPSDEEITRRWMRARKYYHKGSLARRLAMLDVEELEASGVTEEDIDRLFPLTPIQVWLRDSAADARRHRGAMEQQPWK